jgi:hypothetical protein
MDEFPPQKRGSMISEGAHPSFGATSRAEEAGLIEIEVLGKFV